MFWQIYYSSQFYSFLKSQIKFDVERVDYNNYTILLRILCLFILIHAHPPHKHNNYTVTYPGNNPREAPPSKPGSARIPHNLSPSMTVQSIDTCWSIPIISLRTTSFLTSLVALYPLIYSLVILPLPMTFECSSTFRTSFLSKVLGYWDPRGSGRDVVSGWIHRSWHTPTFTLSSLPLIDQSQILYQ